MKLVDRIARKLGLVRVQQAEALARRSYSAGQVSRLTADWLSVSTSADADIYANLTTLRNRSRDLVKNEGYAQRYIHLMRMNVVGHEGFKLQVKAKDADGALDVVANAKIMEQWERWTWKGNCDVTGKLSFRDIQNLAITSHERDGEVLIRLVTDKTSPWGAKLQLFDVDRLDESYNTDLDGGRYVRMGVEFNEWRKPIAYHLKIKDPRTEMYSSTQYTLQRERVPASEMIHVFIPEYVDQTRGVPRFSSVMLRLKMLAGYEEAAVTNARIGASKMGFLTSENGEQYMGDDTDSAGNIITDAEPGKFEQLPPGMKFESFNPDYPKGEHNDFMKQTLRGIASGLNIGYNTLGNDLESVNYSSARVGLLEEREHYKAVQAWFVENVLDPIYTFWLERSLLSGAISLPSYKLEKFDRPQWTGRRWTWVDPESDVGAMLTARRAGIKTLTQIIAEQGGDIAETMMELQQEEKLIQQYGVQLDFGGTNERISAETVPNAIA